MSFIDPVLRSSVASPLQCQRRFHGIQKSAMAMLGCVLLLPLGCSPSTNGPATVPVSGTLTLNGNPVVDARVAFLHAAFAAYAQTDSTGRFELVPGAVVGENKVYISKWEGGPAAVQDADLGQGELEMLAEAGGPGAPRQVIPAEYANKESTSLIFDVPEGGTDAANFDL